MQETIDFVSLSAQEAKEKLEEYNIALTLDEIIKIQKEILKRPPTLTECVLWSIQGSEHSSYKSSKIHLQQFPTKGEHIILGPSEDAGIIEIAKDRQGYKYGIVISHESHNHPSQIVPYEGAATGIGGNVRDIACMGAKVIATADSLRFGEIYNHNTQHQKKENSAISDNKTENNDKLHNKTKWLHEGVVSGIAGYGNPIGVPNIGGDIYYDESYNGNCIVNVVSLGVLREDEIIHSKAPPNSEGYDLILVGKPTDNSGFGGASFASLGISEEDKKKNKGAVQEPNAFLKRHLLKSTYALFKILKKEKILNKVGLKDLGAGGIACASVELADAAGLGAEINIDLVHKSMNDLHPSVILCSETQERFMWVSPPEITHIILEHYNNTFALPKISEGAQACVIGKIRGDKQYIVTYLGEEIVHAKASDVTKGLLYDRKHRKPARLFNEPKISLTSVSKKKLPTGGIQISGESTNKNQCRALLLDADKYEITYSDLNNILLEILGHVNIASKACIYEKYDKNVQGITVIEPGEADAGVIQPFKEEKYPEEIKDIGVAISVDQNPRYCKIDPYLGTVNAIIESMRNVTAAGAEPKAITDCLCFGNPEKPEQMWEFAESARGIADTCKILEIPIISGNVSLYNESNGKPIAPSPIIACVGKIENAKKAITAHFKRAESIIIMIGARKNECGGSVYYDLFNELGANIPKPNLQKVKNEISALNTAIKKGLVLGAHDISDGGAAAALAEMSFKNELGFEVYIPGNAQDDKKIFSETGGFIIEIAPFNLEEITYLFHNKNVEFFKIGKTNREKRLKINGIINIDLFKAKNRWENGLREKFN